MNKAEQLKRPFPAKDIEWRIQRSGVTDKGKPWAVVLAYVTNRAIQNRLDEVFGIEGWQNAFRDHEKAVECGIGAKFGDEWIWKWDAAEETQVEAVKGGRSAAMKRAGVQWGIGRYLYDLEANFAECSLNDADGWQRASAKDKQGKFTSFYWRPPTLPDWALPDNEPKQTGNAEQPTVLERLKADLNAMVSEKGKDLSQILEWFGGQVNRNIQSMDDLAEMEVRRLISALQKKAA